MKQFGLLTNAVLDVISVIDEPFCADDVIATFRETHPEIECESASINSTVHKLAKTKLVIERSVGHMVFYRRLPEYFVEPELSPVEKAWRAFRATIALPTEKELVL